MTYDDAEWHTDSALDLGLDQSSAATHIGMFMAWSSIRGLVSTETGRHAEAVEAAVTRRIPPGGIAERFFVSQIDPYMLTDEGNQFAEAMYDTYLAVLDEVPVVAREQSMYSVADSWETFDEIAPRLDAIYARWRVGRT